MNVPSSLLTARRRGDRIEMLLAAMLESGCVKVCGCRPHDGGAAHTGAGVRKPPREETAGGARGWRDVGYGDLSATDEVGEWSRGAPASLWTVKRLLDERRVASNSVSCRTVSYTHLKLATNRGV